MIRHKSDKTIISKEELDEKLKQFIIDFPKNKLPQIYQLLEKYVNNKNIIVFKTRDEMDNYLKILKER